MRFLANENFPRPSILLIREAGYDVISIGEDYGGISDEEVLGKAVAEDLVILTFDSDYGELVFKYRMAEPPSVVYFRNKGGYPSWAGETLLALIEENLTILRRFTVVDASSIRQRELS